MGVAEQHRGGFFPLLAWEGLASGGTCVLRANVNEIFQKACLFGRGWRLEAIASVSGGLSQVVMSDLWPQRSPNPSVPMTVRTFGARCRFAASASGHQWVCLHGKWPLMLPDPLLSRPIAAR